MLWKFKLKISNIINKYKNEHMIKVLIAYYDCLGFIKLKILLMPYDLSWSVLSKLSKHVI